MQFGASVFYNTRELSTDKKAAILKDCMEVSYEWWVDKLDCSESMSRRKIDYSFEKILEKLNESAHIVVIDRGQWGDFDNKEHFEIGFRSMETPVDYFLFIEVESEKMPPILNKYHLKPISTIA
jgi:hypothetical protein